MLGNCSNVKMALQNAKDVNQHWYDGRSAVHNAALGNHVELLRLLIAAGADMNARVASGETALDLSRARGFEEIVSILEQITDS